MAVLKVGLSRAALAALMVAGCGGSAFSVASNDAGPMGVSPLQEAGAAEGPDDGDAAEAAPPGVDAGGATDATGPDTAPSVADSGSDAGSAIEAGPEAGIAGDGGRTIFGNWIYTNAANTQGYVLSLK